MTKTHIKVLREAKKRRAFALEPKGACSRGMPAENEWWYGWANTPRERDFLLHECRVWHALAKDLHWLQIPLGASGKIPFFLYPPGRGDRFCVIECVQRQQQQRFIGRYMALALGISMPRANFTAAGLRKYSSSYTSRKKKGRRRKMVVITVLISRQHENSCSLGV
jgi:hypothetical protein